MQECIEVAVKLETEDLAYHHRLSMAVEDLIRCTRYCEMMLEIELGGGFSKERTIYESLFISFIVSYGRVFTASNTSNETFKNNVSQRYNTLKRDAIMRQQDYLKNLHERILTKRHTSIAHSDAASRQYQHYSDSPFGIGDNPFYPFDRDEVLLSLELTKGVMGIICDAHSVSQNSVFKNTIFDPYSAHPKEI
jgi:hypothetical protein